ncbi:uncharacterized protein TEOVI_000521600 [Trypanosoma equiperdum]|uniref:Mitochondrial inheritance component MDM10 n=1 Tax=Trypanosoma equiperdum TaxID=5694 RepID=A0A1G4I0H7_TRYEQ|nr:hypothetical protein, conserved [Trypanosoma equiperdum]
MFCFFQNRWESGLGAHLTEELISSAFSDFAPYAGAEQQQTRFVRRQSDGTTTRVAYGEDGGWSVSMGNPYAGGISFATTPDLLCDMQLRIPLKLARDVVEQNSERGIIGSADNSEVLPVSRISLTPITTPYDSRSPFQYSVPPPLGPTGCFGMVELLYSYVTHVYGAGLRVGPLSLRATASPGGMPSIDNSYVSALGQTACLVDGSWCAPLSAFPSCNLTVALQHPFMAVEGDTLAAICLESSAPKTPEGQGCNNFRLLVVQTLATSNRQNKQNPSDSHSHSFSSVLRGDKNWRELGTLVAVQKSFRNQRFRLSAAAMIHDHELDYETAALADVTAIFSRPTVLRLGFNRARRVAMGIATEILNGLTLTLGVHYTAGDLRFGLEAAL